MALGIEGASIGFDANNVQTALNNLNTKVIEETVDKMNGSMDNLRTQVSSVWVGQSAENFKANMEADKNKIIEALHSTYQILESEMYQIVEKMAEVDHELVKVREN